MLLKIGYYDDGDSDVVGDGDGVNHDDGVEPHRDHQVAGRDGNGGGREHDKLARLTISMSISS